MGPAESATGYSPASAGGGPVRPVPPGWARGLVRLAAVTALLAALTLAYFWPVLGPSADRSLGGDFAAQAFPWRRYITEEMFRGRLPHWAPYVGFGFPLLADIEATVFYPVSLLVSAAAGPEVSYRAIEAQSALHHVIAGLGMFLLLGHIGAHWAAALFGSIAFTFCGFFWAHSAHLTVVQSASWGPWTLLGGASFLGRPTWRAAVWTGVAFALALLGGHPQIPYYIALALVIAMVIGSRRVCESSRDDPSLRRVAAFIAAALGVGAGLTAAQLVPTAVLAVQSVRSKATTEFLLSEPLPLEHLITLVIPLAFHKTGRWTSADEFHAYLGIAPLLLAGWALLRPRSRWTLIFAVLAALGLLVALAVPGLGWFGGMGLFRIPARSVYLFDLGVAGLSALGADALLRASVPRDRERRALRALGVIAVLVAAVGLWVAARGVPSLLRDRLSPSFAAHALLFVALVLLSGAGLVAARRLRGTPVLAGTAMIAVLLVDVFSFPRSIGWPPVAPEAHWPPREDLGALGRTIGPHRVLNDRIFGRTATMEANLGLIYGVPLPTIYSSLILRRYDRFVNEVTPTLPEALDASDLMAVRYVLSRRDPAQAAPLEQASRPAGLVKRGDLLWEQPDALPRAYLPRELVVVRGLKRALAAVTSFDPGQTAIVEARDADCPRRSAGTPGSAGEVRFLADEPDRVRLWVRAREAGPLVLSDTYYPGWQASVDGRPVPLLRANVLFRAVCVPAGEHIVEFRYRDVGFRLGLALSAVTLVVSTFLLWRRPAPVPAVPV